MKKILAILFMTFTATILFGATQKNPSQKSSTTTQQKNQGQKDSYGNINSEVNRETVSDSNNSQQSNTDGNAGATKRGKRKKK
ncbi:MAG: hypothetical protein ACRCSK_08740 [Fusobacteriaceae bacterium]